MLRERASTLVCWKAQLSHTFAAQTELESNRHGLARRGKLTQRGSAESQSREGGRVGGRVAATSWRRRSYGKQARGKTLLIAGADGPA